MKALMQRLGSAVLARAKAAMPDRLMIIKTTARLVIGGAALLFSSEVTVEPLHTMAAFGGKLFIAFALFGLIGHIETHLMEAIIRAVDIIGPRAKRIGWAIILPFWIVAMVVLAPLLFRDVDAEVEKVADLHKKNA